MERSWLKEARPHLRRAVVYGVIAIAGLVLETLPITFEIAEDALPYLSAVIVAVAGVLAVRALARAARMLSSHKVGDTRGTGLGLLIQVIGYFVVILTVLGLLGQDVSALLVGGAITGVVIGIAAQQTMANLFAGMVLVTVRPMEIGEHVVLRSGPLAGEYEGVVTDLGLFYVDMVTAQGPVKLPNAGRARGRDWSGRTDSEGRRGRSRRGRASRTGPSVRGRSVTSSASPTREEIIRNVAAALEPVEAVRALWMMGSIAFDRLDELSDIDLVLDVRPDDISVAWDVIEKTLESLAPLDYRHEMPQPTWHGHEQRFFHLVDTPQHLLIDAVIMKSGHGPRFDEIERHGTPSVLFDKDGIVVSTHVDPDEIRSTIRTRIASIKSLLPLAYSLVGKEIERGRPFDAFGFYQRFVVDNLVALARMKHDPNRHDYGFRYLSFDVPQDLLEEIEACCYVGSLDELAIRFEVAKDLISGLLEDLERELA